ncbi:A disintegrin and metalloproteinase with thrombospondin motifs 9 [Zootermopsis nevadensis]|uniref:A disintegrin and metalloproteinase with thrombospondin motifs 9 n=1 Tax=Zootermopsis nevadensis TaxID=136037 RepID=A0A067QR90_ZOONE|nr:A disintegrin and metalloproteinase with thrombospondin motifs 9 [Zootermopsis nevadensis]
MFLFSDHDDDFLEPAAMLLNRTHSGEQYVGEGERPSGRRSKRTVDNEYYYDSGLSAPKRNKRSYSQEYFIELMVVADKKMAEYHGDGLYHYILTLMSIVSTLLLLLETGRSVIIVTM